MQRNATIGIVGVVVVSALVVGIGATALGSPAASVRPSAAAQVPTATPAGETPGAPIATAEPTASPSPTAVPTPTPVPTPVTVPAPLTGRPVSPAVAKRHPIAVMIDDLGAARPQSGLSSASVVWQAPAEGGIPRYMAIFQDSLPNDIGPVRSSRYYYIAWAAEWRAVYAHAGGSPQAQGHPGGQGSRPVRLQRRRVPLQRDVPPDHDPGRAAQPVHDRAKLRARREAPGVQGQGLHGGLDVRPGRAARGSADRRDDHRQATPTTPSGTRTTARPTRTCAP